MQRCRITFSITGTIKFPVQEGEEETAEELAERLEEGTAPTWLESLIIKSVSEALQEGEIDIQGVDMPSDGFGPEDELIFE